MTRRKIHALLATSRIANVPSVVSNVWVGIAVGIALHVPPLEETGDSPVPWRTASLLVLAGICLYVSGNFLNDWMDREWDKQHRPERALPGGLFSPRLYRNLAFTFAFTGVVLTAWVNCPAAIMAIAIVACIVVYTVRHKRDAWAVIPMGLCRAFLPVMGAVGLIDTPLAPGMLFPTILAAAFGGFGLFCYIVGLSTGARYESMASPPDTATPQRWFLFSVPVLMALIPSLLSKDPSPLFLIGALAYAAWLGICHTRLRKPVPAYVSGLLAGIPLVDWIILVPFSLRELTLHTPRFPDDALSLASLAIPPLAFVSALLLQRLAPAT